MYEISKKQLPFLSKSTRLDISTSEMDKTASKIGRKLLILHHQQQIKIDTKKTKT